MKILLVEDDLRVAGALRSALVRHGYDVRCAVSGSEALGSDDGADLVLLDMCLPDMDGFEVCRRFRARSDVPIIAVTARGEAEARVRGLRMGADDYVVKPCGLAELKARIEAVMRRGRNAFRAAAESMITSGDLSIDLARRTVSVNGESVPLSRKEYEIVAVLARAAGHVVTRDQLMSSVWRRRDGNFRTLDVHIATLRRKLESPELIETVRGVGYRLAMS